MKRLMLITGIVYGLAVWGAICLFYTQNDSDFRPPRETRQTYGDETLTVTVVTPCCPDSSCADCPFGGQCPSSTSVRPAQCPGGNCPSPYAPSPYGGGDNLGIFQGFQRGRSGSLFQPPDNGGGYYTEEAPDQGGSAEVPVPPPDDPPQGWRDKRKARIDNAITNWRTRPPEWLVHVYGASGMLVAKGDGYGVILTAYHVVTGGPRTGIQVRFPNGESHSGTIFEAQGGEVSADKTYDLALVRIPEPSAEPCYMAPDPPRQGSAIFICGYGGGRYKFASGRVSGYTATTWRGQATANGTMQTSAVAIGGDSGGAYVNGDGELCGVLSCSDRQTTSFGPGLPKIHQLCTDAKFQFPFGFRQKTRDQLEEQGQQIGQNGARIDELEERDMSIPIPAPPNIGPAPGPAPKPYDDGEVRERLVKVESTQDEHAREIQRFNVVIDEVKVTAAKYAASGDTQKANLAAAVSEIEGNVASKLSAQVKDASDALEGKAEVVATKVAGAAAEKAVEAATPGLLDRLKGYLPENIQGTVTAVSEKVAALHKWVWGSYAGIGVVLFIVWWVFSDVRQLIRTNGENKLTIQKIADRIERVTGRTRNPYDDYAGEGAKRAADWSAEKILAVARQMGWGPQVAPAPAPVPAASPAVVV